MMSYHAQLQRDGDILSSSGNNPCQEQKKKEKRKKKRQKERKEKRNGGEMTIKGTKTQIEPLGRESEGDNGKFMIKI